VAQGGVAKVAVQTALATRPSDVDLHILVFGKNIRNPPTIEEHPEIKMINRKLQLFPGSYYFRIFRHTFKLAWVIMRTRPDLIHLHEPQFAPVVLSAAGMAGGYPVVVHLHSVYAARRVGFSLIQTLVEHHALRRTPLIACSETIRQGAEQWLEWTREPIALIEDGADDIPNWPSDEPLARDLMQAAAGRKIIAKMARLIPLKRIEDFLMACRILLDEGYPIFVLLMSYGKAKHNLTMRAQFESWFAPHEGEFLFRVQAPQHFLRQIDIGVSASSLEGLGLNVLEFQVEGVPVICTDLPAHREMVEDGRSGLLFPVGDLPALVRALKELLDDPERCRQLGEAGRQRAAERTWARTAEQTTQFYREVLSK
jgi:glycosyltransferase involved in cell wall biosynthesis